MIGQEIIVCAEGESNKQKEKIKKAFSVLNFMQNLKRLSDQLNCIL